MKLNNFTSLTRRAAGGDKGLVGTSALDRKVWTNSARVPDAVEESEELWRRGWRDSLLRRPAQKTDVVLGRDRGHRPRRKIRLGSATSGASCSRTLNHRCALTGISQPDLLTASHISPWSPKDAPNRVAGREQVFAQQAS